MLIKPLSSSSRFTALIVWLLVKKKRKMIRSRLLWFTLGFSVTAASISQFIYKDLWTDRYALKSDVLSFILLSSEFGFSIRVFGNCIYIVFWNFFQVKQKFDALETRVSNLESLPPQNPNPAQVLFFFRFPFISILICFFFGFYNWLIS